MRGTEWAACCGTGWTGCWGPGGQRAGQIGALDAVSRAARTWGLVSVFCSSSRAALCGGLAEASCELEGACGSRGSGQLGLAWSSARQLGLALSSARCVRQVLAYGSRGRGQLGRPTRPGLSSASQLCLALSSASGGCFELRLVRLWFRCSFWPSSRLSLSLFIFRQVRRWIGLRYLGTRSFWSLSGRILSVWEYPPTGVP